MNEMPLISVIVPVYNVEQYLSRCVDSIRKQVYENLEILLIDDGATDRSGQICDEYAECDSRIRVIHKENGGLSSARNAGLDAAKGECVCFIDSDDFISEDYVSFLWQLMLQKDADIVHGIVERGSGEDFSADRTHTVITEMDGPEFLRHYFDRSLKDFGLCVNKLYKRELFADVRYPNGRVHEDVATVYKVLYAAKRIVYTDRVIYYYYMSPESIMRKSFSLRRMDWIPAMQEKLAFLKEKNETTLYNRSLQEYQAVLLKLYYCVTHYIPDAAEEKQWLKAECRRNLKELIDKKEIGVMAKGLFAVGAVSPYVAGMICDRMI